MLPHDNTTEESWLGTLYFFNNKNKQSVNNFTNFEKIT